MKMVSIKPCVVCGKEFKSYNPTPMFCSRACKANNDRSPVDGTEVVRLYKSGNTKEEVAKSLNTTIKVVSNRLRDAGVKCRPAVKRNQKGKDNSSWRGSDATYSAFHRRVEVARGKPSACDRCKTTKAKRYEWANMTGRYDDVADYTRLCTSCHKRHDHARRMLTGIPTSKHVPRRRKEVQHAS